MSTSNNITEGQSAPPPLGEPAMAKQLKAGMRERRPTHPGAIVKRDIEALGTSVNAVAVAIGVTRAALGNVVAEKSAVSPDMALRLGAYLRTEHKLLLAMQSALDVFLAREKIKADLARIKPAIWDREEIDG